MSLVEMQAALTRLYTDGPFLECFCSDPESVLADYDLTPEESAAVAGVDRAAVRKFASSLRMKTWGRFKQPYRLIHTLDGEVIRKYYLRFYELRPIRPNEAFYGPNLEFGEFLERSLRDNPEVPPWASDLACYERLFHTARFQPRVGAADPAGAAELDPDEITGATRPRIGRGLRVERFAYDMGALESSLREGEVPEGVEPRETHVVFRSFPQVGRAKKFEVSAATAQLLALADGSRDLDQIAAELDAEPSAVVGAARKLAQLGLLEDAEPPAERPS